MYDFTLTVRLTVRNSSFHQISMNVKETHTTAISMPPVSMKGDHICASVTVDSLEMDFSAIMPTPALSSEKTPELSAEITSLIQMVREVCDHLQSSAT